MNLWYRSCSVLLLSMVSFSLFAEEALTFKPVFMPQRGWFSYGLAVAALLAIIIFLAKKNKHLHQNNPTLQTIDKIRLNHKTTLFIVEYQKQRFLLADNQQSLCLQALKLGVPNEID